MNEKHKTRTKGTHTDAGIWKGTLQSVGDGPITKMAAGRWGATGEEQLDPYLA